MHLKNYLKLIDDNIFVVPKKVYNELKRIEKLIESEHIFLKQEISDAKINFVEQHLKLSDGSGRPFKLTPFQKALFECIYGLYINIEKEYIDGIDIKKEIIEEAFFKEIFILMGRKSGKTELSAVIQILELLDPENKNKTLFSTALTLEQSQILYDAMKNIINDSTMPVPNKKTGNIDIVPMSTFFKFRENNPKSIEFLPRHNTLTLVPADVQKLQGKKIKQCVVDEIHTLIKDISGVLRFGTKGTLNARLIYITTAGTVRDGMYDKMMKKLQARYENEEDRMLKLLYSLEDVEEVKNPDMWQKALPNLGVIYTKEDLKDEVAEALTDPTLKIQLLTTIFGLPQTDSINYFELHHSQTREIPEEFKKRRRVIVGLDMSQTRDFTSVCLMDYSDGYYYPQMLVFKPKISSENLSVYKEEHYQEMIQKGCLIEVETPSIKQEDIAQRTIDFCEEHELLPIIIAHDRWYANEFVNTLTNKYVPEIDEVRQGGITMAEPFKDIYHDLDEGKIVFESEMLSDSIKNVTTKSDPSGVNIFPNKANSGNKIDPFISMFNAYISMKRKGRIEYDWIFN